MSLFIVMVLILVGDCYCEIKLFWNYWCDFKEIYFDVRDKRYYFIVYIVILVIILVECVVIKSLFIKSWIEKVFLY